MACKVVGYAIFCGTKKPERCQSCGARPHSKLCDFPLSGHREGHTCDRKLCASCAVSQGPNVDYCPAHDRYAKEDARDEAKAGA